MATEIISCKVAGRELPGDCGQHLNVPECERGIGSIITTPDSTALIEGVGIKPFSLWPDDRGYFLEVARFGQGLPCKFAAETTQVSAALSYPGTIKAFHYHRHQTDLWVPAKGMFQVVLADLRTQSPTFGVRNTLFVGELRSWQLLIPPGVAHGYKVIGPSAAMLVYMTDRNYSPADEGRIAYNDPFIHYDWETQHK
jgi:dTDP-4-dehydrorhamnose 3,5-epimerase